MQILGAFDLKNPIFQRKFNQFVRVTVFLTIGMSVLGLGLNLYSSDFETGPFNLFSFIGFIPWTTLVFSYLGYLILKSHPKHTVGWLFLFIGFNSSFNSFFYAYIPIYELNILDKADSLLPYLDILGHMIWWPVIILPVSLVLVYFPDGKLISPRWKYVAIVTLLGMVCGMLTAFHSEPFYVMDLGYSNLPNLKANDQFLANLAYVSVGLLLLGMGGSLASIIIKFRRSIGIIRMQMKWLVYSAILSLVLLIGLSFFSFLFRPGIIYDQINFFISNVAILLIPAACGIAIIRHNLWDINIIINRTLVYGGLTSLIIIIYVVIIGSTAFLFQAQTSTLSGLVAAGIIAVLFQPLRERLQQGVNQMLYGKRDDPGVVLTQLAHPSITVEKTSEVIPYLVENIANLLKIPYVAIISPPDSNHSEPLAHWGVKSEFTRSIPLTIQKEQIGELIVALRGPKNQFNQDELDLLETIAALTATTVRAAQHTKELRKSRQKILTTREDERRRIRRDLHDGLGPQLASQVLGLEAVTQYLSADTEKAHSLLGALKNQAQEAILDVRRLVYDLRPPSLDDIGLIGALKQTASKFETVDLQFVFDVPNKIAELPAAIETAIYRIVQEAIANVVRHSEATLCTIHISYSDDQITVEVSDNGCGIPNNYQAGVGLIAMKERSNELNGEFLIKLLPDKGTLVQAKMPLEAEVG